MVEVVWEFFVKEQSRGWFELAHGPGGVWSEVFVHSRGFRGLTLLRDVQNPCRYLAVEVWDAEGLREQALAEHKDEHAALEAALGGWTDARTLVGVFSLRAEATVRSPVRPRRAVDKIERGQGILWCPKDWPSLLFSLLLLR